jgi:transcriptional regulator with XRE-family HTH domain
MIKRARTLDAPPAAVPYAAVVGGVVERLRKQRRVTQGQMAAALGIGQPAYSRLEQGQSAMNVFQLGHVAAQLCTTPSAIMSGADAVANQLRAQGVEVKGDNELPAAAIFVGLGILAAILAAIR